MKNEKNILILLIILEIILIFITYFVVLSYNKFIFSVLNSIIIINLSIIIIIICNNLPSVEKKIYPVEYFYNMSNDEMLKIVKDNIKKLKYKKLPCEEESYIKKEFNGSFIEQKLLIIFSNKYDENLKRIVDSEVEKCKKLNEKTRKLYKRYSLQIILIVEEANIDIDNFYEVKDIYTITANYGN